jgi:sigma54-dependent transcription regulator
MGYMPVAVELLQALIAVRIFSVSRQAKASGNDVDRLRKYLGRFGLSWSDTQIGA